jgi:preprotein translocase subunit SecE
MTEKQMLRRVLLVLVIVAGFIVAIALTALSYWMWPPPA